MTEEVGSPFELMYIHGEANPDLLLFQQVLLSMMAENIPPRAEADIIRYQQEIGKLTSTGVASEILAVMGDNQVMFVPNKYPYTRVAEVFPPSTDWQHLCLWSQNGGLNREMISLEINRMFPGKPALVFVHREKMRSVPGLSHAHVILISSLDRFGQFPG